MQHSNATMATSSLDRISSSGAYQPYNNFRVQTLGGNIIQGQVNKIRVAEVMFPYDTPTVVYGQNDSIVVAVWDVSGGTGTTVATAYGLTVPPRFYTATELQVVLQAAITAAGAPLADLTVDLDPVSESLYFVNTGTFSAGSPDNYVYLIFPTAASVAGPNASAYSTPSLLWTAGFRNAYAQAGYSPVANGPLPVAPLALIPSGYPNTAPYPVFSANAFPAVVGTPYNGRYTDWIDICSPTLCQAQYVRDGNTNQSVIRRDLICRLYIANEVSIFQTDPTGDRPFVIHRQFKNAKVMKWTAERSIDAIDIQLYDQYGLPLPNNPVMLIADLDVNTTGALRNAYSGARDFAITFLVDEHDETREHNVGYTA